jgi:hypothetical protein
MEAAGTLSAGIVRIITEKEYRSEPLDIAY